jgi:hypothetical protein
MRDMVDYGRINRSGRTQYHSLHWHVLYGLNTFQCNGIGNNSNRRTVNELLEDRVSGLISLLMHQDDGIIQDCGCWQRGLAPTRWYRGYRSVR